MAFVSGSASSMADLAAAILAACAANGWSQSGNVLYKGNLYVEITSAAAYVNFRAGTGQSGGVLSGAATNIRMLSNANMQVWTFPVVYEVHLLTDPDEVYVVVNHDTTKFQFAAWGQSTVPDIGGTGMWISATCGNVTGGGSGFQGFTGTYEWGGSNAVGFALFGQFTGQTDRRNSYIHTTFDGTTAWRHNPCAFRNTWPLVDVQPNAWNGETVLIPMPASLVWSSGEKVSIVAHPAHVRSCRITNHLPFDIVNIGGELWRLYPWRQKNTASPNGVSNQDHSGTWGFAVRYTGP